MDPSLLWRVATNETPWTAAQVLTTSSRADPALITAAQVLTMRPDLTDPALIAAAAREPKPAATVLAARPDISDPAFIAAAAQDSWAAARVLAARPDISDPAFIAAVASIPTAVVWVLAVPQSYGAGATCSTAWDSTGRSPMRWWMRWGRTLPSGTPFPRRCGRNLRFTTG